MELHGGSVIAGKFTTAGEGAFKGFNPVTGQALEPEFRGATAADVELAMQRSEDAFAEYRKKSNAEIAEFLEAIAAEIEKAGDELLERAHLESGLPPARLVSERGRTTGQLRMFAELVREGSWVDARIDRADAERKPAKPDLRRMLVPIGPVVVFGASNFPLAFSVCGGDTASALAARNPVVVKGHPAHPGTSEITARAVQAAVRACGMPDGVFSLLQGSEPWLSLALVRHRLARAVAFTGSLQAGRALFDAAAMRPVPIPVFAEMGSLNPVLIFPGAMRERGEAIAQSLAKSVTLGVGQFCTKPGLVLGLAQPEVGGFVEKLSAGIASTPAGTMLHAGIAQRYRGELGKRSANGSLKCTARTTEDLSAARGTQVAAAVFFTDGKTFLEQAELREEVFGPASLVVECSSPAELKQIARSLEGQLTVTIHATEDDLRQYAGVMETLREKTGRLIFGGVPTGVEVAHAIQHGGPYPATTDSRFTSVGSAAILRFARPICLQDCPAQLLPPELQDGNPLGIWRMVEGKRTQAAL